MNSSSRNLAPVFILVAAFAMVLIGNVPLLGSGFKNGVYFLTSPLQQCLWSAGANVGNFLANLSSPKSQASENEQLRLQLNDLMVKSAAMEELKKENEFLRQGLNLELDKEYDLKLARVTGKEIGQDIIMIDKGAADMIQVGLPVITAHNSLVGRVSKVYPNFSQITLITNDKFSFDVKVGDGIDCLAKGAGSLSASVDLVPKDKEIRSGDAIITSSLGGIFPPGLLVGTIKDVNKNDAETFQKAAVSLAFDLSDMRQVFVANGKYPLGMEIQNKNE